MGCSCADLKEAGYSEGLKLAGFTAKECKDGGYNAKALKKAGFSASDCKAVGYDAAIKAAGFSIEEARGAFPAVKCMLERRPAARRVVQR